MQGREAVLDLRQRALGFGGALPLPGQVLDQRDLLDPVLLSLGDQMVHDIERGVLGQFDHGSLGPHRRPRLARSAREVDGDVRCPLRAWRGRRHASETPRGPPAPCATEMAREICTVGLSGISA